MDESSPSSSSSSPQLHLPGFRFHPTEEELLHFYLENMLFGKKLNGDLMGLMNIYNYHPSELPVLAKIGEREWYFFVPRDTKHGNGGRANRTTRNGFWKATGLDKKVLSSSDPKMFGLKKTLAFYEGRVPRGRKTDWVINGCRFPDGCSQCCVRYYRKVMSFKALEQRAAMEDEIKTYASSSTPTRAMDSISFYNEFEDEKSSGDWNQESFWMLDNLTPFLPMC